MVVGSRRTLGSICSGYIFTVDIDREGSSAVQVVLGYADTVLDGDSRPVITCNAVE